MYCKLFNQNIKDINTFIFKNKGKNIYWWGTGSTSVIYLNQIDKNILKNVNLIIIDGHSNREGFFIPVLGAKIISFKDIENSTIEALIIASSFYDHIISTMNEFGIKCNCIKRCKLVI